MHFGRNITGGDKLEQGATLSDGNMKMELGEMRCDSVVRATRFRIEVNGGLFRTPRFWLHPIIFLKLTCCGVISKLHCLRQGSWVSKQIIYFHPNCRMSAFALV